MYEDYISLSFKVNYIKNIASCKVEIAQLIVL